MNKNLVVLAASLAASIFILALGNFGPSRCEGFGCVGLGISLGFFYFLVPIILGVFGAFLDREHRLKQAFISFGIALAVAVALLVPIAIYNSQESPPYPVQESLLYPVKVDVQ